MAILLKNAMLAELDPARVWRGSVLVEEGRIARIGEMPQGVAGEASQVEVVDCSGFLVMPAMTVGHTHLYSSLAVGMPPPPVAPANFVEILQRVWWKLDEALDEETVYLSALAGAIRAARSGVAVVVDHHASPNAIGGSLGLVRQALAETGLRGILCYETTDRHCPAGASAGLAENARFLESARGGMFAGMVGAHASFTLEDGTLRALGEMASHYGCGVHIHCAEDSADVADARARGDEGVLARLIRHGAMPDGTLLAHCTHLCADELRAAATAGCWIAHNPRSNMNNAVGYAPTQLFPGATTLLGTDGMDSDMFAESRAALLKANEEHAGAGMGGVARWLRNSARFASRGLGVTLGCLEPGAQADLLMLDYAAASPVEETNLPGHFFFGIAAAHVHSLMVAGRWVLRDRRIVSLDEDAALERARRAAARLWQRIVNHG